METDFDIYVNEVKLKRSKTKLWYARFWKNAINLCSYLSGLPKHLIGVFFSDEIFELKKEIEKLKQDAADKDFRLNICVPLLKKRERRIIELEDEVEHLNRSNGQLLHLRRKLGSQVKEFLKSKGLNGGNRG